MPEDKLKLLEQIGVRDSKELTPKRRERLAEEIRKIAYVSGDALSLLPEAVEKGYDAYVTGEPRHSYYWYAYESGINVFFAGHYVTERLGVLAVGELLREKFGLEVEFLELPTGH